MKSYLFLRFAQYRAFWNARRSIAKAEFLLTSRLYRANQSLKDAGKFGIFFVGIVRVTAKPWFLAVVVAAILQVSNPSLCQFFSKHGFSVPDDSDYVTFLAAISSIGGVFIGLYYAAIATVGSAMYAKVPSNLRDLLSKFNRMGHQGQYMTKGVRMLRWGSCYRHDPNATSPRPFVYEVGDKEWPLETWRQGTVLIRNPNALHPLPENWFGAAVEHKLIDGEVWSTPSEYFLPFSSVAQILTNASRGDVSKTARGIFDALLSVLPA